MGTVRDYFESDTKSGSVQNDLSMYSPQGIEIGHKITVKIHLLIEAHSKFISIFAGKNVAYQALLKHFESSIIRTCHINGLMGEDEKAEIYMSVNHGDTVSVKDLSFSGKIILYIDNSLSDDRKLELRGFCKKQSLMLEIRDTIYSEERSKKEKPLAFISHSKKDSRDFATKLANELSKQGCPVWFDEFSLSIGDSLLESIDEGLKSVEKCIFILSPEFLADEGWCKHEFKSASMKQIFERKNVMLPIWGGISKEEIYEYSPALVDTMGLDSSLGVEAIAKEISKVLLK